MENAGIQKKIECPPEVIDAALDGKLVVFVGAGVSRLAGLPGWDGWAKGVLEQLVKSGVDNILNQSKIG